VRFTDAPGSSNAVALDEDAARAALFSSNPNVPYRDDPAAAGDDRTLPDVNDLDNQQLHAFHSRVIAEQDEALDRLGDSIRTQRELSIQIGDELDGQVALLDEVEGLVDRHQSRLEQAKRGLGKVARGAKENSQLTIIIILIVILVLLIAILK
jgi:syntaxin 8